MASRDRKEEHSYKNRHNVKSAGGIEAWIDDGVLNTAPGIAGSDGRAVVVDRTLFGKLVL